MKTWIIASAVIALLLVVGIVAVQFGTADNSAKSTVSATSSTGGGCGCNKASTGGCGSCNGECTAEKNCGLAGCGAANGGACTCGKK